MFYVRFLVSEKGIFANAKSQFFLCQSCAKGNLLICYFLDSRFRGNDKREKGMTKERRE